MSHWQAKAILPEGMSHNRPQLTMGSSEDVTDAAPQPWQRRA